MSDSTTATIEGTGTKPADVVVRGDASGFLQEIVSGAHQLHDDEPVAVGGGDAAPGPYDYVLVGLGACTSMTVGLYARTKKWPLENISVSLRHSRIHAKDCAECETKDGMLDRIERCVDTGTTRKTDGDRGQVPGPSHPKIGDKHPPANRSRWFIE